MANVAGVEMEELRVPEVGESISEVVIGQWHKREGESVERDEELVELESELNDQLVKLKVARATQRARNTAQFSRIRKDIARVKTIVHERKLGIGGQEAEA